MNSNQIKVIGVEDLKQLHQSVAGHIPAGGKSENVGGHNIVTVEVDGEQHIESYNPNLINDTKGSRYSEVASHFTEELKTSSRFRLNPLTRKPLALEDEENQRIEAEVQRILSERLTSLEAQVKKQGYEDGFKKGLNDGIEKIILESKPNAEKLRNLVIEFDAQRKELFTANEELFLKLVHRISKNVILRELKTDADYVKRLTLSLLDRLGTKENIKIFLNAEAYSAAEQLKAGLAQILGELKNVNIEIDPEPGQTGCRLETEFGDIDARIESQLEAIASVLSNDDGVKKL